MKTSVINLCQPRHFRKIDKNLNMQRFYAISLQPTPFGEWSLIRKWGRIGCRGQKLNRTYAIEAEAVTAFQQAVRTRLKRNYAEVL